MDRITAESQVTLLNESGLNIYCPLIKSTCERHCLFFHPAYVYGRDSHFFVANPSCRVLEGFNSLVLNIERIAVKLMNSNL